jgi:RHS repeat-associated protein
MQSGGANYYFSYDHLSSVREVTDTSGNVVSRYDYDPYGRLTVNQGVPPRFGFAGQYYHSPSGLDLTEYRAYDPNLGRWESRDPVPFLGANLYTYADDDPQDLLDPDGATPFRGQPNTWQWLPSRDAEGKGGQWRLWGPNGEPLHDQDWGHPEHHPELKSPHGHDWDHSDPENPSRGDARELDDPRPRPADPTKPQVYPVKQWQIPNFSPRWHQLPDFPSASPAPPWLVPALALGTAGAIVGCIICPECCAVAALATL